MSSFFGVAIPILFVFIGCMGNHIFLEALVRADPGIGPLVTFTYFLVPALLGLFGKFMRSVKAGGLEPFAVPVKFHFGAALVYFVLCIVNNLAFSYKISMPLHTIFRSSSLVTNLFLGWLVMGKWISQKKLVGVILVTVGITAVTFASANSSSSSSSDHVAETMSSDWFIGIGMLVVTAFTSSMLGIIQETIARKYGKHAEENLFMSHGLAVPMFAVVGGNVLEHFNLALTSDEINVVPHVGEVTGLWDASMIEEIFPVNIRIPVIIFLLICTNITQYVCISSVFTVVARTSSLTLTLVITLRKFLSIIVSVIIFKNPFTVVHWFGTLVVMAGTLLYSTDKSVPPAKDDKKKKQQ